MKSLETLHNSPLGVSYETSFFSSEFIEEKIPQDIRKVLYCFSFFMCLVHTAKCFINEFPLYCEFADDVWPLRPLCNIFVLETKWNTHIAYASDFIMNYTTE